jgi:hypothetical protein
VQVVRRDLEPGVTGRVEPPLEDIAVDHQRTRQLATGRSLLGRSDIHHDRTGAPETLGLCWGEPH